MGTHDEGTARPQPRRHVRVPVALAVTFVGSASAVSIWYGGCTQTTDPPLDALHIANQPDASPVDAALDASDTTDAPRDAAPGAMPDGPPPQ
ncbi:MAG TPA: hypothetical protein VFV99_09160 [Kofleriaceae bacterium]|nr:hypothetical protein [Kofleriaceae bacterium]